MSKQFIIFTDLNGTLLDHNTYSFHKAAAALELCCEKLVPVIFNTSKTYAHILPITQQLDNSHPFVVENGAAIYVPKDYFSSFIANNFNALDAGAYWLVPFGKKHTDIIDNLTKLSIEFKFECVSDLAVEDVAMQAHLPLLQANHIKQRQFSELIVWHDTPENLTLFKSNLAKLGLCCLNDGIFYYISSNHDKSASVKFLRNLYDENRDHQHTIVALGDGNKDIPMFNAADIAIIVSSPVNPKLTIENHPNVIRAKFQGPIGWNDSVLSLFNVDSGNHL